MKKYLLISMTLLLTVTVVLGLSSVVKKGSVLEVERYQNTAKSDPALLKKIAQLDKNVKKFYFLDALKISSSSCIKNIQRIK